MRKRFSRYEACAIFASHLAFSFVGHYNARILINETFHAYVNLVSLSLTSASRRQNSSRSDEIGREIIRHFLTLLFVILTSIVENVRARRKAFDKRAKLYAVGSRDSTRRNDFLNTLTSRDAAFHSHCIVRISPYSTLCSEILFAWTTLDLDILRKFPSSQRDPIPDI